MVRTCVDAALQDLEWLEDDPRLTATMKEKTQILKMELRFIRIFLLYIENWREVSTDAHFQSLQRSIEAALSSAGQGLYAAALLAMYKRKRRDWELVVSNLMVKINHLKQEIRVACDVWSKCSLQIPSANSVEISVQFLVPLLENLDVKKINRLKQEIRVACDVWPKFSLQIPSAFSAEIAKEFLDPLLENLDVEKIDNLKQEIRVASDVWSKCSLQIASAISAEIVEFLDPLLQNLDTILALKTDMMLSVKKQIEALKGKLQFLRNFVSFTSSQCNEHVKWEDILTHVGAVSGKAACVSYMCWVYKIDENDSGLNIILSDLLQCLELKTSEFIEMSVGLLKASKASELNIVFKCKVASFVDFLLESMMVHVKYQFEILHEQLVFLILYLMGPLGEETRYREKMLVLTESVVNEAQSLIIYSYKVDLTTEEMQAVVSLLLSKLQEKAKFIMVEVLLMELLKNNSAWMVSVKDQTNALHEGLRFLIDFLTDPAEKSTEDAKLMLVHMEEVAKEAAALIDTIDINQMTENLVMEMNLLLVKLFDNVKLIKQVEFLIDLLNHKASKFVPDVDLQMDLSFLKAFLMELPKKYKTEEKLIFTQIETVVSNVVSSLDSISNKAISENTVMEVNLLLSDLLEKIKFVKAEVSKAYLQAPRSSSNFPWTDGAGFVEFFIGNLWKLLNDKADLISLIKNHVEIILRELEYLRPFLGYNEQELRDLGRQVVVVAYQAEYAIDLYLVKGATAWYCILWLSQIIEDIMLIKKDAPKFSENTSITRALNVQSASNREISWEYGIPANDLVVGLKNKVEDIKNRLLGGYREIDIIPIVGTPGLGKTTLAKNVYEDPLIISKFHISAWCYVSQVYEKRDLFIDILSQVTKSTDEIDDKMTAEDLAHRLYKSLRGRKYLIVLDDIWDAEVWGALCDSFPNDCNASRIIFTSRLHNLASEAGLACDLYSLRPFTEEECSELLQKMLFRKEGWPQELSVVGTEIAKHCDGLPLLVVVIAGNLAQIERTEDKWKEIEENLKSTVPGDSKHFMAKLDMSYRHLPDHLKACFLYLGAFAFEREIPVWKLKRLWIAEGLVREPKVGSLEDAAESILKELIDRSLVMISKLRSNGRVKACRIHNLLRDLCLKRVVEENFLQPIRRTYRISGSQMDFSSTLEFYEHHRLSIYSRREDLVSSIALFGQHARSLLFFASDDVSRFLECYDISFIYHNFKILRVLDLSSINIGDSCPKGLALLIHLRYLAIRGHFRALPSIVNLWNLETLLVKGLRGEIELPDTFWRMARLRHVQIIGRVNIMVDYEFDESSYLDNLETLTTPSFYYSLWSDVRRVLRRLPNLRKLRCVLLESWNNEFPELKLLSKLESVKVLNHGYLRYPCHISLPSSLKKLTLSKFRLPWDAISTIGRLPNLEVLKLLNKAFHGHRWDMKAGEFQKLKYLKLSFLEIVEWNSPTEYFPCLEQLVLQRCEYLEEIPSCLMETPKLQLLQLQWCSSFAANSARKIQEEQLENGNEELKVLIHPEDLDVNSS